MMEEEDEEILHSTNNGAMIAVTVASTTPPPSPLKILPPPIPIQKQSGGGREDCWSEGATGILIGAWGKRYLELNRGNLKQKHWQEVAEVVNSSRDDYGKTPKTDVQCKNRVDTVKKKYKLEKARIASGGGVSKWVFFEKLDHFIGPIDKISKIPTGIPVGASNNVNLIAPNWFIDQKIITRYKNWPPPVAKEMESDEEEDGAELPESGDSLTPPARPQPVKKRRTGLHTMKIGGEVKGKEKSGKSEGMGKLTQAILRFGEAYEKMESAKIMQVVNMERQRMKIVRELEMQTLHFFTKTQLEISQMKVKGRREKKRY
jgi:hypothetical protein